MSEDMNWQLMQEREAAKHTAPVCPAHAVQFAICGCENENESEKLEAADAVAWT